MNAWKFRHEGSPVASADLPFDQVMQGLIDGKIHVEDEVKGPSDAGWQKFEDHPAFAEIVSELEPEEEEEHEEETSLDMNPMIDVALVLLIFFMLTTSYSYLQKIMQAPKPQKQGAAGGRREVARDSTVTIKATTNKNGTTSIFVEGQLTPIEDLIKAIRPYAKNPDRRMVALDHDDQVPHGVIVQIIDNAKTAGMTGFGQLPSSKK